jgi:membrane associated rhomboid family serine protease
MNTERIIRVLSWIIPFGIYPIASEAFGTRKPYVVRSIAIVTIAASIWFWVAAISGAAEPDALLDLMLWSGHSDTPVATAVEGGSEEDYVDREEAKDEHEDLGGGDDEFYADESGFYKADDLPTYHPRQLVTHAFLHAGLLHLAGNMLFLIILGSRVNAVIGNVGTLIVYPLFAVVGGLVHMQATADWPLHPMLGASGAVMGMAGMYLIFFPLHKVHMAIWQRWGLITGFRLSMKLFAVRGFWVVLFCIAFSVVAVLFEFSSGVAHWAHLGGFLAGVAVALALLGSRLISCKGGDLVTTVLGRWAWPLVGKPNRPPKGLPLP